MTKPTQPFGKQAATFSLYAPTCAMLLGYFSSGAREKYAVAGTWIFCINMILFLSSFALGIVALISMKRHGRKGILWPALAGVIISGGFLGFVFYRAMPLMTAGYQKTQVVGRWQMRTGAGATASQIDLTLNQDGTFKFDGKGSQTGTVSMDGRWAYSPKNLLGLRVDGVTTGDPAIKGKVLGLGEVTAVDSKQLVLKTDKGTETYQRLP